MIIGNKIYHKPKVYNSLKWAQESIDFAPDGSIFLADIHEKTIGRGGRQWQFDENQLAVTILLKPNIFSIENTSEKIANFSILLNQLNMAVTLGILEPLKKYGVNLKWSNDFVYKKGKIGGVLSIVNWWGNCPYSIIFGFGLNVNNEVPILDNKWYKADTLSNILSEQIDKQILLNEILESIDIYYKKWLNKEFNYIFKSWKNNQSFLKQEVSVHDVKGDLFTGIFYDVLANGDMILKVDDKIINIPFCLTENLK